jgi:general secretion pathway protein H
MRILEAGSEIVPPRSLTACSSLPPEGALRLRPGKAGSAAPTGEVGQPSAAAGRLGPLALRYRRVSLAGTPSASADLLPLPLGEGGGEGSPHSIPPTRQRGFTLLELLVVMMIIAFASAGVALAMRDGTQTQLEREGERLAVLFESARAQSRANGNTVIWRVVEGGFRFEGLPPDALPNQWLSVDTVAAPNAAIQLGPEPIIGAQSVELASLSQPERSLRVVTDGLQPFAVVQTAATPQ